MARILLLEDNPDMVQALIEVLEMHNYEVVTAYNGREGLRILESGVLPDLIITDLKMPLMDGLQFMQFVRGSAAWAHIPVAIMSGETTDSPRITASGADAFILKPFHFDELEATLNRLLNMARSSR